MQPLKAILVEIYGLFVDDGSFAVAILLWIVFVWLLVSRLQLPIPGGIVLFLGLGTILLESVRRFAKRRTPR